MSGSLPTYLFSRLADACLRKHLLSRRLRNNGDGHCSVGEINCLVARNNFIYTRLPLITRPPNGSLAPICRAHYYANTIQLLRSEPNSKAKKSPPWRRRVSCQIISGLGGWAIEFLQPGRPITSLVVWSSQIFDRSLPAVPPAVGSPSSAVAYPGSGILLWVPSFSVRVPSRSCCRRPALGTVFSPDSF